MADGAPRRSPSQEPVGRSIEVLGWIADDPSAALGVREIARDLNTSPTTVDTGVSGLAILAFLLDEEGQTIYERGVDGLAPETIVDPAALEVEVTEARSRGSGHSTGQRVSDAVGFAAPVFDATARVGGDVCVTKADQRYEPEATPGHIVPLLITTAELVTKRLKAAGYWVPAQTRGTAPAAVARVPGPFEPAELLT